MVNFETVHSKVRLAALKDASEEAEIVELCTE